MITYEQPLNERIRNCLRLEYLFSAIATGIKEGGSWNARDTIARMLEVCDFLIRTDIKGELIKELERNFSALSALRSNPGVNPEILDRTLADISEILAALKPPDYQPGTALRNDELMAQIRQRISIPGGTCSFDVPALHYWLNVDHATRLQQFNVWMQDLRVMERATCNRARHLVRSRVSSAISF